MLVKKLGQFGIILLILSIGEILQGQLSLPIPATVIGMVVLLILLLTKILKLTWVEGASKVLLDNMGLFFVPAGVGIMNEISLFQDRIFEIIIIIVITTILVMVTTGYTVQVLVKMRKGQEIR